MSVYLFLAIFLCILLFYFHFVVVFLNDDKIIYELTLPVHWQLAMLQCVCFLQVLTALKYYNNVQTGNITFGATEATENGHDTKSPVKSGALFCSVAHLAKENSVKSEKKADKEAASVSTHFFLIAQLIQLYGVLLYWLSGWVLTCRSVTPKKTKDAKGCTQTEFNFAFCRSCTRFIWCHLSQGCLIHYLSPLLTD